MDQKAVFFPTIDKYTVNGLLTHLIFLQGFESRKGYRSASDPAFRDRENPLMHAAASTLITCVALLHARLRNMHLNLSPGITNSSLEIILGKMVVQQNGEFQSPPPKLQILLRNYEEWLSTMHVYSKQLPAEISPMAFPMLHRQVQTPAWDSASASGSGCYSLSAS